MAGSYESHFSNTKCKLIDFPRAPSMVVVAELKIGKGADLDPDTGPLLEAVDFVAHVKVVETSVNI